MTYVNNLKRTFGLILVPNELNNSEIFLFIFKKKNL